jgi:hypothetical protein
MQKQKLLCKRGNVSGIRKKPEFDPEVELYFIEVEDLEVSCRETLKMVVPSFILNKSPDQERIRPIW